jgi:hypothetical protein
VRQPSIPSKCRRLGPRNSIQNGSLSGSGAAGVVAVAGPLASGGRFVLDLSTLSIPAGAERPVGGRTSKKVDIFLTKKLAYDTVFQKLTRPNSPFSSAPLTEALALNGRERLGNGAASHWNR